MCGGYKGSIYKPRIVITVSLNRDVIPRILARDRNARDVDAIYPEINISVIFFTNCKAVGVTISMPELQYSRITILKRGCLLPPRDGEVVIPHI